MMERDGKPAGHDFGDNRVPGDGQRVRECLTERPELDNQPSLILTHRDGFPRLSVRSAWRGGAGHREPRATRPESPRPQDSGKPPFRSRGRTAGVRRQALPMSHIACGSPPARRIARAISMGQ